jgi:hypothetical protein
MKRKEIKKIFYIGAVILLLVTGFLSLVSIISGDEISDDFILPHWGGGMVHSDPQMSDNIRLPVPTTNVGQVWYHHHELGGELFGTYGNGIAGNNKIAANTFYNPFGKDNLIIYDYYGNHIWSSGRWPFVEISFG